MASNSFGTVFTITTWGESHGKAIGVVIDGCPAGLLITQKEIQEALDRRAPGKNPYTSPRCEPDAVQILSGILHNTTTGAPICLLIENTNHSTQAYQGLETILRPGHATYTYLQKYGIFDHEGGGRASARETACRVAAGAVARKLLTTFGIEVTAYLSSVGTAQRAEEFEYILQETLASGDSVGGVVTFVATGLPPGLGDPTYEKLEAKLAHAMLSIPASKAFEIGLGFRSSACSGSSYNDLFTQSDGRTTTTTNHSGGILGGISNGMPVYGTVAFKPTSSIKKPQRTITQSGDFIDFELPEGSRHDPCVAIRAVPVVEAMLALVLADALLMNRCAKI